MRVSMDVRDVLDAAKKRLGQNIEPVLDYLAKCGAVNLEWYLERKIVEVGDSESEQDNRRVLKYAYNFCRSGAKVTFVRESSDPGVKTPDLKVEMGESQFYVEVKKFRAVGVDKSRVGSAPDPISKIVGAVTWKRAQLPPWEVGFVAIDNFDHGLEWDDEGGFTHDHLVKALCELQRSAAQNPSGWKKPGGVIISANTTGGVVTVSDSAPVQVEIPHFVWINEHSRPPVPERLAQWVSSSLPNGNIFDSDIECSEVAPTSARSGIGTTG